MTLRYVRIYPRYERFYHWSQFVLIMVLLFSGADVHGLHGLIPFGLAVKLHTIAAVLLMLVWIFTTFWHFTTGDWKHYLPTSKGLFATARYYAWGIFKGEAHPFNKRFWAKNNPLQAFTYVALKMAIFPAIWISGLAYLSYALWDSLPGANATLGFVATVHVIAAFVLATFVIIHVYLLTTGHGFKSHVRPMVTGYDVVDLTKEEESYLETAEPERLGPLAESH